jgi:hypothetical protein
MRSPRGAGISGEPAALIERLTLALGPPVSTPEFVRTEDGSERRSLYRVHCWRCPACRAGFDDPIYRPLVVNSDGRVWCGASRCSAEAIAVAVRRLDAGARVAR